MLSHRDQPGAGTQLLPPLDSVEEGDMPHCVSLGVHEHPVPSVEDEGGVIRMCDPARGEDLCVADHLPPTLAPANVIRQRVIARLAETVSGGLDSHTRWCRRGGRRVA